MDEKEIHAYSNNFVGERGRKKEKVKENNEKRQIATVVSA